MFGKDPRPGDGAEPTIEEALQKINIEESRPLFRKIEKEVIEFERGKLLVQ